MRGPGGQMNGGNPLMTFEEYRLQELRWHWYSLRDGATDAEREAFALEVEEKIRATWQARECRRDPLKTRMKELAWQHLHVRGRGDDF